MNPFTKQANLVNVLKPLAKSTPVQTTAGMAAGAYAGDEISEALGDDSGSVEDLSRTIYGAVLGGLMGNRKGRELVHQSVLTPIKQKRIIDGVPTTITSASKMRPGIIRSTATLGVPSVGFLYHPTMAESGMNMWNWFDKNILKGGLDSYSAYQKDVSQLLDKAREEGKTVIPPEYHDYLLDKVLGNKVEKWKTQAEAAALKKWNEVKGEVLPRTWDLTKEVAREMGKGAVPVAAGFGLGGAAGYGLGALLTKPVKERETAGDERRYQKRKRIMNALALLGAHIGSAGGYYAHLNRQGDGKIMDAISKVRSAFNPGQAA